MKLIDKVELRPIEELKPYENNPKAHPLEQIEKLVKSIKEYGFDQPIVVDKDGVIIKGHARFEACKKMGLEKVSIIKREDLDNMQIRGSRLADNKVAESEWDMEMLAVEFETLDEVDFTGFDEEEIMDILDEIGDNEIEEDDFDVDDALNEEESITELGDIIELGKHRLMCGDSTNKKEINKLMNGNKADMVFTDPPYGMNAVSNSGVLKKNYKKDIIGDDDNTIAIKAFNLIQDTNIPLQVWWGANYYSECLPSSECWLVWDKNNGSSDQTDCELGWTNFRSVVRKYVQASKKSNRVHPTQKPVKLVEWVINRFDKENIVNKILDIFGGSGTTLIAAEQLNRTCYMMELDEHYCDVIVRRYIQYRQNNNQSVEIKINGNKKDYNKYLE